MIGWFQEPERATSMVKVLSRVALSRRKTVTFTVSPGSYSLRMEEQASRE